MKQFQHLAPEVVVAMRPGHDSLSIVPGLRGLVDRAASIVDAPVPEERQAARKAGADSFPTLKTSPAEPEILNMRSEG